MDGKCPDCGREVKPAKEEAYFFKMSKYADRLIIHINKHTEFIQPVSRKNEMMNNFLLPGLQDLCVSRTSFKWGIPVEFDPKHVVYVWLDALTNYITGIGYHCGNESTEQFQKEWPADLHLIGKDIVRFHTIYWPIFLMALDLPLPKQVFGHPWLLMNGNKMSKSKGNTIYADDLVDVFGVDSVRYFVLHEMPYENDGNLTWELVTERNNSDLANIVGNLLNRTVSMSNKYFGGTVKDSGITEPVDEDLKAVVSACRDKAAAKMDELRAADAITEIMNLFKRCNKYIDETMPWALAKDEAKLPRLETVLYNLVDSICVGASLLQPFLPGACDSIFRQLNTQPRGWEELDQTGLYPSGNKVTDQPEILFARLDEDEVIAKAEEKRLANLPVPEIELEPQAEEQVDFETFCKSDFRAVKVKACEAVKKSDKLLRFTLDDGTGTDRQILSGIHKWYEPEALLGKTLVAIVNLPPRKMMGLESCGMLISAVHKEKGEEVLHLLMVDDSIPAGAKLC